MYRTLDWLGICPDQSPNCGGPHSPYKQSERTLLYRGYADKLVASGAAYKCYCTKSRLDRLRHEAEQHRIRASYDRKCLYSPDPTDTHTDTPHTVRLRTPDKLGCPPVSDLWGNTAPACPHTPGHYEDPVLVKSDGMPTYHLASVVDDHEMHVTLVIRGAEWLPSWPKQLAVYKALDWTPPDFIHVPLLMSMDNSKLSKRHGHVSVAQLRDRGYLPEAVVDFVLSLGVSVSMSAVSAASGHVRFPLARHVAPFFSLHKTNRHSPKVDYRRLDHLNKLHYQARLSQNDPVFVAATVRHCVRELSALLADRTLDRTLDTDTDRDRTLDTDTDTDKYKDKDTDMNTDTSTSTDTLHARVRHVLLSTLSSFASPADFAARAKWLFTAPRLSDLPRDKLTASSVVPILEHVMRLPDTHLSALPSHVTNLSADMHVTSGHVFSALRLALYASNPGFTVPEIISFLGVAEVRSRIKACLDASRQNSVL